MEWKKTIKHIIAAIFVVVIIAAIFVAMYSGELNEQNDKDKLLNAKELFFRSITPSTTGKEKIEMIEIICNQKFPKDTEKENNNRCYRELLDTIRA